MRGQAMGALALVVAVGLGTAGCGEDSPKPGPVAKEPRSSTTSAAPSRSPDADTPSEEGAREFVQYFVDSFNYANSTGDTSALRSTFVSCAGCAELTKQVDDLYAAKGYVKGGEWKIDSMRRLAKGDNTFRFEALIEIGRAEILRSKDAPTVEVYKEDPSAVTGFLVKRAGSTWTMAGLEQSS